jgi:hypothetical protein
MYKLTKESAVFNDAIGLIPFDARNVDFKTYQQWLADGNTPLARDPDAPPSKDEVDVTTAKNYAKLTALKNMSPAEIQTWTTANVTTVAQCRDAITTLAVAVSILARRL